MIKGDPRQLAIDLTNRSVCAVRVAAVIWDATGRIITWGWNHSGTDGLGEHAEIHALSRANRARLVGASIAVAGRRKTHTIVVSFPCANCSARVIKAGVSVVWIEDKLGCWKSIRIND